MVAFNFQKQFVPLVEQGKKLQTMRVGVQRCWPEDKVQLYTAQRTKKCRKLGEGTCTKVIPVRFNRDFFALDNSSLDGDERDEMAILDGFKNWDDMVKFFFPYSFEDKDDFVGYLYKWELDA